MYFNTFKTAISIQIAPTIKIRKKNYSYFFFPCSYSHARFTWRQCVSIVLSAGHFIGNKVCRFVTLRAIIQTDSFDSVKGLRPLVAQKFAFVCPHRAEYDIILNYHISSNNGCPSIDRLPQLIAPPRPSRHLLFLFSRPCQVVVQRDSAKLVLIVKIQGLKINLGTKFGTLKKPMFSLFDVIIFWFNGKINNKIFRARLPVSNIWYNRLPRIISPPFCAKKEIIAPGYYSRKYGNSWKRKRALLLVLFLTLWVKC